MPQLVEVPDHGLVEFPDGMDDDAIASAIKSQSAPSSSPSQAAPPEEAPITGELSKFLSEPNRDVNEGKPLGGAVGKDEGFVNDLKQFSKASLLDEMGMPSFKPTDSEAGTIARLVMPVLNFAPKDTVDQIAGATSDTLEQVVKFPTTPLGAAAGVAGELGAGALVAAGFAAHGLKSMPEAIQAIHEAKTPREMTSALLGLGLDAGMILAPFLHEARPAAGGEGIRQPVGSTDIEAPPEQMVKDAIEGPPTSETPTTGEPLKVVAQVTTTGETPTPEMEARQMLANMGPRVEQKIIGKETQPLIPEEVKPNAIEDTKTSQPDANVQQPAGAEARAGEVPTSEGSQGVRKSGQPEEINPSNPPPGMKLGGGEAGALNFDVVKEAAAKLKEIPGAKDYAEGWKSRVEGFGRYVDSAKRIIQSSEQRDKIPALYDAAETQAGYIADQARNHVDLAVKKSAPSPKLKSLADQAATFIAQANGDRAGMEAKLDAIRGKGYDDVIDYAKSHWDELQKAADAAKEQTDAAHAAATDSGIDVEYREGYAKGAYEEYSPSSRRVVMDAPKGGGGASSSFTKPKVFNDYSEAIAAGFTPKTLKLSDLTQSAVLNTMKKVNRRQWVTSLGSMEAPDGLAIVRPAERITTKDSEGIVSSHGLKAPDGYKLQEIEPGSLVAVHEDFAPLIEKLTSPSTFPRVLGELAGGVKHNMLAFDIYHGSRFGQMQMAFMRQKTPSFRKGLALMEYADSDLAKAVKAGDITQKQADFALENRPIIESGIKAGANIGRISDALFKDVAPLFPYAKATTHFIFNKLSRGIIAESYVYAFKRNAEMRPNLTPEQLHRFTAKEINTYYRNLGNQGLLKNKTFQDISRFMLLAPQWFEGRIGSEVRGVGQLAKSAVTLKKPGSVGAAMGTGLVAYFAINQLLNMATRGHPTWENPEPGHKLDAWIPDPSGSTGQFISPLSVFAETTHDVMKLHESGDPSLDIPADILKSQVGPVPRTLWDLGTGRDFYGQKMAGLDRFTQAAKDLAPVPLVLKGQSSAGSGERQIMSFAGVKSVGAGTASTNAYKLADQWMRSHDIKRPGAQEGEQGPASIYRPLRQALEQNDMKAAREAFKELKKTTSEDLIDKHFSSLDNVRFTGRKSTEDDFIASLKPKELRIYNKAIQERQRIMDRYDRIR